MSEHKEKDGFNAEGLVIIEGIPALRGKSDYHRISSGLEDAAEKVAELGSKVNPVLYIPCEKKQLEYSEETVIDGCAFIQFGSLKDAQTFRRDFAMINATTESMRKKVNIFTQVELNRYLQTEDEYQKMRSEEYKESRNMLWWLRDPQYRDQFVVRFRGPEFEETQVFWMDENKVKTGRELCYDASDLKEQSKMLTDRHVHWSPNGLYLLSTHRQGVQLWGGPHFANLQKFAHQQVELINFSPNETFLITALTNEKIRMLDNNHQLAAECLIWDVLTGHLISRVAAQTVGPAMKLKLPGWWPVFRWSHDEKYLAKLNSSKKMGAKPKDLDKINLYEMVLVDETADERYEIQKLQGPSLTVNNLFTIEFSPTDNVLAYTTFANNDDQSKVTLLQIPSRSTLKTQILGYDVKKAHLYWQSEGTYLAVSMGHSGARSTWSVKDCAVGVISVKDRQMPYSKTEKLGRILFFAWEPAGDRFAVIHNPRTKRDEPDVSVFRVQSSGVDKGKCKRVLLLGKRRMTEIYWAPRGGRMVIVHVDPKRRMGGELEFIDIAKVQSSGESCIVQDLLHETVTDIQWDPSGRYLATATTMRLDVASSGDDTKYIIWSYQGEKLFEHKIKHFFQILWRPRPKMFDKINKKARQSIHDKLAGGWSQEFTHYDQQSQAQQVNKKVLENQKKLRAYNAKMKTIQKQSVAVLAARAKLRGDLAQDTYRTKTVQLRMDKKEVNYPITKEVMKKLLAEDEDVIDFQRWRGAKNV